MIKETILFKKIKDGTGNFSTDGCRLLMVTLRSKEGGHSNRPDRRANKIITVSSDDFLEKTTALAGSLLDGERLYCSVNPRNLEKSIVAFKHRLIDKDGESQDIRAGFYIDIKNQWISCLAKNKAGSNFLIDIDHGDLYHEPHVIRKQLEDAGVKVLEQYWTKNGYHLITEPYQYPKLTPTLAQHIKTDAMALLAYN